MYISADTMKFIVELGLSPEKLVELVKRLDEDAKAIQPLRLVDETAERRREWDRDRKRAKRMSGGIPVETSGGNSADASFLPPSSPEPPTTTNLSPVPPIVPQKSVRKRTDRTAIPEAVRQAAKDIWSAQPILSGKRRATCPDVEVALLAALERGGCPEEIVGACRSYYALPASRKDGGEFAMGAQRLLERDRWREFTPGVSAALAIVPASPEEVARRLRHLRDTGEWKPSWGPQPATDRSAA